MSRHSARGAVRALSQAISNSVPAIVLVVTLTAYKNTGKPIVASTIFTAISLFNQLRFPLFFYPMLIDSLANGKNALRRVASYLSSEEITPYVKQYPYDKEQGGSIEMKNGNFLWQSSASYGVNNNTTQPIVPALCGANVNIRPGEIVAVTGSVGSGKTALIKGLLGELAPVPRIAIDPSSVSGVSETPSVSISGSIAYCAQESWLPKGSIRDAIVFGREYDEARYKAAIYDSCLDEDIYEESEIGEQGKWAGGVLTHETDVGEGGSALSGGQRARVALARALYAENAGVYLLDDPLSALDASVGSKVFDRLSRRLKQSKAATVFVTNDPTIPQRCDRVILMINENSGSATSCPRILDIDSYDKLLVRGHALPKTSINKDNSVSTSEEDGEEEGSRFDDREKIDPYVEPTKYVTVSNSTSVDGRNLSYTNDTVEAPQNNADCQVTESITHYPNDSHLHHKSTDKQLNGEAKSHETTLKAAHSIEIPILNNRENEANVSRSRKAESADDNMTTGAVPRSVYMTYLKSVRKPALIIAMLACYLMANGAQFFQQYVVAKWTEIGRGDSMAMALGTKYLKSLAQAAGVVSIFLWLRSYLTMRVGVNASTFLHSRMLSSVFRAPVSFFDSTPSGQILSRFGKELDSVDRSLPDGISAVLYCFLQVFFSAGALAGVVTPGMIFPLAFIGILYAKTMSRFRPGARDLKRIESKSRAPIYTHFTEALRGTETIRSIPNGIVNWSTQHRNLANNNLRVYNSVKSLDRWLTIRLETLGNIIVLTSAVASVFLTRAGRLKAGAAGWGLTQALSITGLLTWAVRCLTDLESQMMSVLRISEITDLDELFVSGNFPKDKETPDFPGKKMPREFSEPGSAMKALPGSKLLRVAPSPKSDGSLMKSGWPWSGGIEIKNVSMRYNEVSPPVLKNLSLSIPAGTTLGIVGRTGSGKSSLLLLLFRLFEIEGDGSIEIDGVDTRSVSIQSLRESLSIIPQDPVLFAGSVLYNLDATGKSSREDAWKALEAASPDLARQFRESGNGLDTLISEGGKNLSVGQRQLMCLARALLRKSKILVMDEATSSVDGTTDEQVQETIRNEFLARGVTIITVAHRLDTIINYDKIAVLKDGKLVEYGSPSELRIKNGEFRKLIDADRKNKMKVLKLEPV